MLNAKAKGTRRERKSIELFEAQGYQCTRSAGSLGPWDAICVGPHDIVLLQVKSRKWPGAEETATLALYVAPPNVRKVVHRWENYARDPDVREL